MTTPAVLEPVVSAIARVVRGGGVRLGVHVGLVAFAVSCTDGVTAPDSSGRAEGLGAWAIAPDVESVVLHRTVEMDGVPGSIGGRTSTRQNLLHQLRAMSYDMPVPARPTPRTAAGARDLMTKMSLPQVSMPARLPSGACRNGAAWTRTQRLAELAGTEVVVSGVGDAPATQVRVIQGGRTIATVLRSWVRMDRSWELTRQEITMPARNYRETVEVERRPPAGGTLRVPLPLLDCVAKDGARRFTADQAVDPFGAFVATRSAGRVSGTPRRIEECVANGYGDPCAGKRDELVAADIAVAVLYPIAVGTCAVPEPFQPLACAGSTAAYLTAVANLWVKKRALQRCLDEQAAKQKACACAGGVAMEMRLGEASPAFARIGAGAIRATGYLDCADDSPMPTSGDGSGTISVYTPPQTSPGQSGAGGSARVCVYDVEYDLDTGQFQMLPLYCYTYQT